MGGGWTLDFEFGTCIWDLDLGLDLGLTIEQSQSFNENVPDADSPDLLRGLDCG